MRQRFRSTMRAIIAVTRTALAVCGMTAKRLLPIAIGVILGFTSIDALAVQVHLTDSCGNQLSGTGATTAVDQNGNLTISGVTGNYVSLLGCGTQPPTLPACSLSASTAAIAPGGSTTLYANCSSSPTSYAWTSPSDTPSVPSGPSFAATFPKAGTYTYSVAGSNASGLGVASNQLTILVGDSTSKPNCTISFSPVILIQGNKSRLQSVCNPAPTSYLWAFDQGGTQPSGAGGEYTFTSPGTFTYKLRAANAQGTGPTASATVTVSAGVTIANSFSPTAIPTGGNSSLAITLSNANSIAATGVGFTDTHPTAIQNSAPANASSTCGGTLTAADGGTAVTLSGGTVPASGSCTIQVSVTSSTSGSYNDSSGTVNTANMGSTPGVSASLTVMKLPTPLVSFAPTSVATNATSVLTLKASNPNGLTITGAAIAATYPAGLVNAATPSATSSCGGVISAPPGGTTLSVTGINISTFGLCSLSANVTSATAGSYVVTLPAGSITTSNDGSNTAAASATLTMGP